MTPCAVVDCKREAFARGWCALHHNRNRRGIPMDFRPPSIGERFWGKTAWVDTCRVWVGARDPNGYGRFGIVGRRTMLAHRVAWLLTNGEIPDDSVVCHHCDNPSCVWPPHLFLGTHADNVADKMAKGRHRRDDGRHWTAKLTPDDVRAIRHQHAEGVTYRALATEFRTSVANVAHIVNRETWRDVA